MSPDTPAVDLPRVPASSQRTLPKIPSAARIESLPLLKACIPARAALATFAQALTQSSVRKSAAEVYATLDAVGGLQLEGVPIDRHASLIAPHLAGGAVLTRHLSVRKQAHERLYAEPVGSTLALELAAALSDKPVSVRRDSADIGEPVLSKGYSARLSPPRGAERLQALLENWQGFVQRDSGDLDPLLMSAVAHGQWIAIRPFTQSNVAVGQLLTSLLLSEEGLIPEPAFPLALYFSRHSDQYWKSLQNALAFGDYAVWIRFFMASVQAVAIEATEQIMLWEQEVSALPDLLSRLLPKTPSPELLAVCSRPAFGMADVVECGLSRRQTASSWMQRLVEGGVLSETRVGKEKRFINNAVMAHLVNY